MVTNNEFKTALQLLAVASNAVAVLADRWLDGKRPSDLSIETINDGIGLAKAGEQLNAAIDRFTAHL